MPDSASRLRIVVLGYIVRGPIGGMAWHHLHYVLGLARLGHDVCFVEDSDDYPSCYDPHRHTIDTDPSYGLRFAERLFRRVGLADRWAYHDAHTSRWFGGCAGRVIDFCETADLLLNVSSVNPLRPWFAQIPTRVLIDTDPVFLQIRHLTDAAARDNAQRHTAFFSFGENLGTGRADCPCDGFHWQPTRQPIVLDEWPTTPGPVDGHFTTVMQWDSYAARQYEGRRYGMKSESFQSFLDLPRLTDIGLELAVGSSTAPRQLLHSHGWRLRDPLEITRDPWTYQEYIQHSKGEFSVAKHGYVVSRCGWFSERSAAYLAAGRPVLLQETGFSDWLTTDGGVVGFNTADEALAGLEDITSRYDHHSRTAREVARQYFDARRVLPDLLERAIHSPNVLPPISEMDNNVSASNRQR